MLSLARRPAVKPLVRPLRIALSEDALVELCREAARDDEMLLIYLLPYVPFRAAKRRLPTATLCALVWETKADGDLPKDLATAMAAWAGALRRNDRCDCRRAQRLVAALLRIAGIPEGDLLWHEGLSDDGYALAHQAIS